MALSWNRHGTMGTRSHGVKELWSHRRVESRGHMMVESPNPTELWSFIDPIVNPIARASLNYGITEHQILESYRIQGFGNHGVGRDQ